jgi:bacteriocin-like protein
MTNSNADKKPASKSTPVSRKPDAELNENELEQISGGAALAKPIKKPNKVEQWP